MKSFAEYEKAADEMWASGEFVDARQNYLSAIFAYEGDEDDPDIDFEFYLRLADCYAANGEREYALACFDRVFEMVRDDKLTTAMVFVERSKMSMSFGRDEESLFDLRRAKSNLSHVNIPSLDDLKQMLWREIDENVQITCGLVYGNDIPWPVNEPALARL